MNNSDLKSESLFYYNDFLFNVTKISKKINFYNLGYNRYKHPHHEWEYLAYERQDKKHLSKDDWFNTCGIGAVLGYKSLRALDIDHCYDFRFIQKLFSNAKAP